MTLTQPQAVNAAAVDQVIFKWLMAGVGWWVDLPRLQWDDGYCRECLQRALGSGVEVLRRRGPELLGQTAHKGPLSDVSATATQPAAGLQGADEARAAARATKG